MSAPVQLDLVWWKDVDTTASDIPLLGEFFIFILSPEKKTFLVILNVICLSAKSQRYSVDCHIRQRMANKNKCTDI